MTLNFESEYEKELPFDAREVAEKVTAPCGTLTARQMCCLFR